MALALALCAPARAAGSGDVERQVIDAARGVLAEQARRAGVVEPLIEVASVRNARPNPPCAQPVVVEGVDTRHPSRLRFAAMCGGSDGWRQEFVLRASVSARVLVAVAELPAGRPIAAADLALERRDVSAMPDAISDPREAAGMSSRRPLHVGDVVRKGALAATLLVRRGQSVRIVAHSGPIEVSVDGEALEDGTRGAAVRVKNAGNGNVIRARVTAEATVEPEQASVSMPAYSAD